MLKLPACPVTDSRLAKSLSDHSLDPRQALLRDRHDVELRLNVENHDLYASALYRNDCFEIAAEAVKRALSSGTCRADFHYHANMNYGALGDVDRSISLLGEPLAINPGFSPLHALFDHEYRQAQGAGNRR